MSTLSTSIRPGEGNPPSVQPESPVVRLLRITRQGLTFESRRRFETGVFIDLGVHLSGRKLGGGKAVFLNVEGFLVDCQPLVSNPTEEPTYHVTVLFSDLDSATQKVLEDLTEEAGIESEGSSSAMDRHEWVQQQLERAFGMN